MPEVTLDAVPLLAPGVVGRLVDSEAVLVLTRQNRVEVLNAVGARIWSLVDGSRSIRLIAAQLCTEYQVEPAEAERDTLELVGSLIDRGAFTLATGPDARQE
jgi:hypothetical protein